VLPQKSSPGSLVVLIRINWSRDHRPDLYPALLSFFLRASTAATCTFTTPTCTATIITFAPCAEFQHFISGFNKISLHGRPHSKSGFGSKRRLKDRVKTRVTLRKTLLTCDILHVELMC